MPLFTLKIIYYALKTLSPFLLIRLRLKICDASHYLKSNDGIFINSRANYINLSISLTFTISSFLSQISTRLIYTIAMMPLPPSSHQWHPLPHSAKNDTSPASCKARPNESSPSMKSAFLNLYKS